MEWASHQCVSTHLSGNPYIMLENFLNFRNCSNKNIFPETQTSTAKPPIHHPVPLGFTSLMDEPAITRAPAKCFINLVLVQTHFLRVERMCIWHAWGKGPRVSHSRLPQPGPVRGVVQLDSVRRSGRHDASRRVATGPVGSIWSRPSVDAVLPLLGCTVDFFVLLPLAASRNVRPALPSPSTLLWPTGWCAPDHAFESPAQSGAKRCQFYAGTVARWYILPLNFFVL